MIWRFNKRIKELCTYVKLCLLQPKTGFGRVLDLDELWLGFDEVLPGFDRNLTGRGFWRGLDVFWTG